MILTNRNHNHFNLIYYNNKLIYYKFIIEDIYINELTYLNKVFKNYSNYNKQDKHFKESEKIKNENKACLKMKNLK